MQQYLIQYQTKNTYEKQAWGAFLKFLVYPYSAIGVQIKNPKFSFSVEGTSWISNSRNSETTELFFKTEEYFNQLGFQFSAQVTVPIINPFEREWLLPKHENEILESTQWQIDNYAMIHLNPLKSKSFLAAKDIQSFTWIKTGSLLDKIIHLRDQVYHFLEFKTEVTDTNTCAKEILLLQQGVCQDFAHLFIGLLRNFGVAARYTSGYLHQGEGLRGASQLHAWVECHIPGVGWIGVDPTNQLLCDHHYIKICHGYDYDDCLPVTGVVHSSAGKQSTKYQVNVQQIQQNQ